MVPATSSKPNAKYVLELLMVKRSGFKKHVVIRRTGAVRHRVSHYVFA